MVTAISSSVFSKFNSFRLFLNRVASKFILALFFGALNCIKSVALILMAGSNWTNDSLVFVLFGRLLSDFSTVAPIYLRTLPYLLINSLTLSHITLWPILIFQAVLSSVAIGFLVYSIAITNRFLSVLVGFGLFFDLVFFSSNRMILIEGPLSSLLLIALAFLLLHLSRPDSSKRALFLAGLFYGFCMLFRQSYLPMLVPIVFFYAIKFRSFRHALLVASGIFVLLASMSSINAYRTGDWRLWAQGGWYAEFPMFNSGFFSSNNGPSSRAIADNVMKCNIAEEPENIRFLVDGGVSQWDFENCMRCEEKIKKEIATDSRFGRLDHLELKSRFCENKGVGQSSFTGYDDWYRFLKANYRTIDWPFDDRVAALISNAYYSESLPNNLDKIPGVVVNETGRFLYGRTYSLTSQFWMLPLWKDGRPDSVCPFPWCQVENLPNVYPFDGTGNLVYRAQEFLKPVTQLYLYIADCIYKGNIDQNKVFAVFCLLSLFILIFNKCSARYLGFFVIMTVFYTAAINAIANVYILRYTSSMSVMYTIHGALVINAVVELIKMVFGGIANLLFARHRFWGHR